MLEPEGPGFRISRSALTLRAKVPSLDEAKFTELATTAEKNCPVSNPAACIPNASAIVKQPACAAAMSSSGLVPFSFSNRVRKE
jgi:hypothetical protein